MKQSTAVCVIGPGRAGTSVTMRVLNLLGVCIGPEEGLVEPGPGGPKGFWERREIIELNDRLLRSQRGSWRSPPKLPPGWESAPELEGERREAGALLERTFAGHELWGWKDPRVSLTTAFWQRLAPNLRYVICLRNPLDTTASISPPVDGKQGGGFYYSRRGLAGERAHRLWLAYTASALANTAGRPRLLVSFGEYFDDRRGVVERLARFVGLQPPPAGGALDRRIGEFVEAGLRHHRSTPQEAVRDDGMPAEIASLYLMLELLRAAEPPPGEQPGPAQRALAEGVDLYARRLLEEAGTR